jgi:hypothetical protein
VSPFVELDALTLLPASTAPPVGVHDDQVKEGVGGPQVHHFSVAVREDWGEEVVVVLASFGAAGGDGACIRGGPPLKVSTGRADKETDDDLRVTTLMLGKRPSRRRAVAYGLAGIGALTLVVGSTTQANAAPHSAATTTATVISRAVNLKGESCSRYDMSDGNAQGFIDAAEAAHKRGTSVCLAPDLRLIVSGSLTVSKPASLDFSDATITKSPDMNNWVITVSSPGVTILGVTLNGDRVAGGQGGGLLCEASGCRANHVHVTGMTTVGIEVRGKGHALAISNASVTDTFNATSSLTSTDGVGVLVDPGALLRATATSARSNSGSGFRLVNAAAGSSISGSSSDNQEAGLTAENTSSFTIGTFDSNADWHYGIAMWACTRVRAHSLTVTATGAAEGGRPLNSNGSAIELFGVSRSTFRSLRLSGMPGYGLALAGATKNVFGNLQIARDGKGVTNPGVNLDQGAADNTFRTVSITDTSVGVDIGSNGVSGTTKSRQGNVHNTFGTLTLVGNTYASIDIGGGSHNVFKKVNATDVGSGYPPPDKAAIRLFNSTVSYNTIDEYNTIVNSSYPKWNTPYYLVYADAAANHNSVHLGTIQGGYSAAKWHDANGTNTFN